MEVTQQPVTVAGLKPDHPLCPACAQEPLRPDLQPSQPHRGQRCCRTHPRAGGQGAGTARALSKMLGAGKGQSGAGRGWPTAHAAFLVHAPVCA